MSGKDSTRSLTNHWHVNLWPRSVNVGSIDYLLLLTTCMLIETLVVIDVAPTVVTISFVLTAGVLPPHPQSHVDKHRSISAARMYHSLSDSGFIAEYVYVSLVTFATVVPEVVLNNLFPCPEVIGSCQIPPTAPISTGQRSLVRSIILFCILRPSLSRRELGRCTSPGAACHRDDSPHVMWNCSLPAVRRQD